LFGFIIGNKDLSSTYKSGGKLDPSEYSQIMNFLENDPYFKTRLQNQNNTATTTTNEGTSDDGLHLLWMGDQHAEFKEMQRLLK
jgi:hypothetical protein